MKFFLLLLVGLCAVVANAQEITDFPEWNLDELSAIEYADESDKPALIRGFVDKIFDKLKEYAQININSLEEKLENAVNKFLSQLFLFVEFSLQNVEGHARDGKVKLIMNKNKNTEACSQKYVPELDNIVAKSKRDVENCVVKAIREISNIKEHVKVNIDAVKNEIVKLMGITKECVKPFSPISTTKCLWKNAQIISSALKDIVSNAYKALKQGTDEINRIVSEAKDCITKVSKLAEYHVEVAINATERCIESGLPVENVHQQDFFYSM